MVMHQTVPALDGKVLDAAKFNCATSLQAGIDGSVEKTDGKKNLFVAFNEVANKSGYGYVTYNWPKPKAGGGTTEELYTKMSFVKKFEGWNWLIGLSFNRMIESFQEIIRQVVASSQGVMQAADKLSESSQRVAARSQSQSDATAETAAEEEVTVSISHVTDNSQETRNIAQKSGELSLQGGDVVQGAVLEMDKIAVSVNQSSQFIGELGEHSRHIAAIVGVIKEIADQTNLLALNAAIEAARAGESMSQIREGADRVIAAVSDISSALREQSAASNQVSQKVEVIARMTEGNSVAANEIANEAQQLKSLAGTLGDAVSRFKT